MAVDIPWIDGTKRPLHFTLKTPCAECPFRSNAPMHEGVASDLPKLIRNIEKQDVIHTCHRTDSRSDYPKAANYKGKLQHCAGLLSMLVAEDKWTAAMVSECVKGNFDHTKLRPPPDLYTMRGMVMAYYKWLTGSKRGRNEVVLHRSTSANAIEQGY